MVRKMIPIKLKTKREYDRVLNILAAKFDGGFIADPKLTVRITRDQYNLLTSMGIVG